MDFYNDFDGGAGHPMVLETYRGAKNQHPTVLFRCQCGGTRLTRASLLRRGKVTVCVACSRRDQAKRASLATRRFSDAERIIRARYSEYKLNAKRKARAFDLTVEQFTQMVQSSCDYCGEEGVLGVDRVDSGRGYTWDNCVPCCSLCNFAKRDLSRDDFLNLVKRIHDHQGMA